MFSLFKQVIEIFLAAPINNDLDKFKLTKREWDALKDFKMILAVNSFTGSSVVGRFYPVVCALGVFFCNGTYVSFKVSS